MGVLLMAPAPARGWDGDDQKSKPPAKHNGESDADDADKVGEGDKEATISPIKKLVLVKIDQNLIPARMLNLALPGKARTVRDLVNRFDKWADDDEIGALLLDLDGTYLGFSDVEELRDAIGQFRKSGKKLHAFVNSGDPMSYMLACESDEIAMAPTGSLAIPGLGRAFPYMRGYYQMLGIEFDVITAGKFKYPGFLNRREPDKYFQEEFGAILDSWFGDYVNIIAEGRKLSDDNVKEAIDVAVFDAEDAKNRGLIDRLAYYDDYVDSVARRHKYKDVKEGESDFSRITSLQDLMSAWSKEIEKSQERYKEKGPKVAILNARGPIIDVNLGSTYSSMLIMRDEFVKSIEEIRKNKTIKAVVLRVDSPGGSGYASDVIWRKLKELDEEKPLVVSMGNVAGSGGYYIACPGRLIFAQPTTITGSIGVLAVLANQASLYNRMDVNLAEMSRGARSLLGSGFRDMKPEDRQFIQDLILDFYEIFLDRVASTRKMPKEEVRKIAGGRIYTGRQALEIGLIDRLGGLDDAIAAVRELADIPRSAEIKLVEYPRPASIGDLLFGGVGGLSLMTETTRQSQQAVPQVSFDSQVRFFGSRLQPLCWMGVPDGALIYGSAAGLLPTIHLPNRPGDSLLPPAAATPAWLP
jgi:protease-4